MKTEEQSGISGWFVFNVLTVFLILIAIVLALPGAKISRGMNCLNNQKQTVLGAKIYAEENDDMLPWEIPTNRGGLKEVVSTRDVYQFYLVMSNEMPSTKVLVCPKDNARLNKHAESFSGKNSLNSNSQVSYLLNVTSTAKDSSALLLGDRNLLFNGKQYSDGRYYISTEDEMQWGPDIHTHQGNIAMMDGSVRQTSNKQIKEVFQKTGRRYVGLAIP